METINKGTKIITRRKNGTLRVATINEEPSKTDQSFKDECDINHILAKFKKTGQITHLSGKRGVYADVSELPDLLTATQLVQSANDTFNQLPAAVREKFRNSPVDMVDWLQNQNNHEEAVRLGLMVKKELPKENDDKTTKNPVVQKSHSKPSKSSETPDQE